MIKYFLLLILTHAHTLNPFLDYNSNAEYHDIKNLKISDTAIHKDKDKESSHFTKLKNKFTEELLTTNVLNDVSNQVKENFLKNAGKYLPSSIWKINK